MTEKNFFYGVKFFTRPQYTWKFIKEHFIGPLLIIVVIVIILILIWRWRYYTKNVKPRVEEFRQKKAEFKELIEQQDYTPEEKQLLMEFSDRLSIDNNPLDLLLSVEFFDQFATEYIAELKKKTFTLEEKGSMVSAIYRLRSEIFY